MSKAPVALIMAGGTGGHIMPGLAVADVLKSRGWTVFWLGNPEKMEGKLVPASGYEMAPMRFAGVRGKGLISKLKAPFMLMSAVLQAWRQFSRVRPDVVLGMGGYVAFPGGLVAWLRKKPLVLHEQNAIAGMANRTLSALASKVLVGFPKALPGADWVGNPVRSDVANMNEPAQRYAEHAGSLRLLVVGGSLGASALNQVVPEALARLDAGHRLVVTHQSGAQHIDALRSAYQEAGVEAHCVPFIDDMAGALRSADLLICRAGAMTVAEVAAAGVAALFIPFPHAVDDHQTANARFLSDEGAAWIQQQSSLNAEWLADWLSQRTRPELMSVAIKARKKAKPHSAKQIADICSQTAGIPA
jgi:UDP-N-acetylglucosamine--N-acetylmuramyl-(pentapeptide) pyrophosphoryl-undecaprenol N-acetylglucosamine transferase